MHNPFDQSGQQHYDRDGLPVDAPAQPQAFQQPFQQQYPVQPHGAQMPMYAMGQPQVHPKSWPVALLLAFFFGTLGVHNFYLGNTSRGVAQLVLTLIGWATSIILIGFFFLAVVGVWAFVEVILILLRSGSMAHDSQGVPLK
ncbi:TM2 domain-containing protein [Corynebacterium hylobatis]|nr:TM2 domain-containing protein [Corynebacterium hylobatis]